MLQLSLDGRRLYVTNSLYSTWDNQFYPDMRSWLLTAALAAVRAGWLAPRRLQPTIGARLGRPGRAVVAVGVASVAATVDVAAAVAMTHGTLG